MTDPALDRVRPSERINAENSLAEATVLASALLVPKAWQQVRSLLQPGDIWRGDHGVLFDAMLAADEANLPVTPATVYEQLTRSRRADMLPVVTRMLEFPAAPDAGHLEWCLVQIREHAKRRKQAAVSTRMRDAVEDATLTPDQLDDALARLSVEMEVVVEEATTRGAVPGLSTFDEFMLERPPRPDWIVPGLLDRLECVLVLSGSGIGKSWLSRQVALNLACGLHPFRAGKPIPPKRVLIADMENPATTVHRQTEGPYNHVVRMARGEAAGDRAHLWLYPDGLNVRKRKDAALFERVIAETRPDVVFVSSLYNVTSRGRDDWDTAAEETVGWFNRMRARYRCGFWIEHHMPRGEGTQKHRASPFGSTIWERWPSYGRVISHVDGAVYAFGADFREDREAGREFPVGLVRGAGPLPWMPIWDTEELDMYRPKANGKRGQF